jgi:hypothetical protein
MTRILLFIKHRLPFLWNLVEHLNEVLFVILHGRRLENEASCCLEEFKLDDYEFRSINRDDLKELHRLINGQGAQRLEYFRPHGFDHKSLSRATSNRSFLMFGVYSREELVGYFFLRCFWNRRCFVGRLIDQPHEKRGIGRVMNDIMYHTAWRSGFRCHTTISKKNSQVMRSHANNPAARILKELPDDYLFVEFVEPNTNK